MQTTFRMDAIPAWRSPGQQPCLRRWIEAILSGALIGALIGLAIAGPFQLIGGFSLLIFAPMG